jgi:hypothetical protein
MVNIVKLQQNIILNLIFLIFLYCQTIKGPIYPVYKNLGKLKDIFPEIKNSQISLYFDVYSQIYKKNLTGELILIEKSYIENFEDKKYKVSKLNFILRILSKNHNNHIRLKVYKGNVYYNNSILDLHTQDCYTYAKKNYEDRFYVIEGWDCDHMIFVLKKENDRLIWIQNYQEFLNQLPEEKQNRIQFTKWFLSEDIVFNRDLIQKIWYGKYIDETEEFYIYFGLDANRYINKGDSVYFYPNNQKIVIAESIGDFLFIKKDKSLIPMQNNYIYIHQLKKTDLF